MRRMTLALVAAGALTFGTSCGECTDACARSVWAFRRCFLGKLC